MSTTRCRTAMPSFSLGDPLNGSPHSVCVSLPTMQDVIGYERHDPRVRGVLQGGYPRFVEPPLRRRWRDHAAAAHGEQARANLWWAVASPAVAAAAVEWAGGAAAGVTARAWGGGHFVTAATAETGQRVKAFLQHTGGALSTRVAERLLAAAVPGTEIFPEARVEDPGRARAAIIDALGAVARVEPADIRLTHCGMNAFYAAWRAVNAVQAARGRVPRWLRLGWLYLDTWCILDRFGDAATPPLQVADPTDLAAVEAALAAPGGVTGIIVEVPGNPLAETPDLPALRALADRYGAALVIDPSIASLWNADVAPWADLVVTSLTKYTAAAGDVMAGALLVPASSRFADPLRAELDNWHEPLADEDAARLAVQVASTGETLARIDANAREVAAFLASHPAVTDVLWAEGVTAASWAAVRRPGAGPGGIVTFSIRGTGGDDFAAGCQALAPFYDAVALAKSPSFGTAFTMLCPYLYLAHFDLVTTTEGRCDLRSRGLNPELIRLAVGAEPVAGIIGALRAALDQV